MTSLIMSFSLAKQNENQNGPKKKKYYENRTKSNGKSIKLAPAKQNLLKARFIFGAEVSLDFFSFHFICCFTVSASRKYFLETAMAAELLYP